MKLFTVLIMLVSVSAFAQKTKASPDNKSFLQKYGQDSLGLAMDSLWQSFKMYNIDDCRCPYLPKPGEKVSDLHPHAKFINDTTLWEWKDVDVWGNGKPEKIYDLKSQYKDYPSHL